MQNYCYYSSISSGYSKLKKWIFSMATQVSFLVQNKRGHLILFKPLSDQLVVNNYA